MAVRGAKPRAAALHLVDGTFRPDRHALAGNPPPVAAAPLEPPKKLTQRQRKLWADYIAKAWWLTEFDVARAFMWVCLHAEFEMAPSKMVSARIAQLRALGSELGLDPASRARMASAEKKAKDPNDKFFAS